MTNLDSIIKSRDINFPTKVCLVKAVFSSSHVWMWELDHKESWTLKNWCFWTVVLEKILENPLDSKEVQPVNPKGNQSWISIGRTDAEAETPILYLPDAKRWLIGKDPDAGKDDGWMPSPTQQTWVRVNSGSWWWTGKPGVLQSMGSQRVEHDWATELNWAESKNWIFFLKYLNIWLLSVCDTSSLVFFFFLIKRHWPLKILNI